MDINEHELLVSELSKLLPYNIICETDDGKGTLVSVEPTSDLAYVEFRSNVDAEEYEIWDGTLKPYLRPLSSMTKEEETEYKNLFEYEEREYNQGCNFYDEWKIDIDDQCRLMEVADWLYKHHFDCRGLIGKGLAIEAPENMYTK
jgi:hypothetical protein